MCKSLKISTGSYYNWIKNKDVVKINSAKEHLKDRILSIFNNSRQTYGSTRIMKALEREGLCYSRAYISVLMKEMGLQSIHVKQFKICTTDSNHQFEIVENILNRDFTSHQLGEKWVSDITYIRILDKWYYVTTIIDLADRKIVAWTLSADMTTDKTIYKTWLKAQKSRQITSNHIFHSDRGVQYASNKIRKLFSSHINIKQSMSRKGNCWDNAVAESFFKTLKIECTNRYQFKSKLTAFNVINDYIKWYNNERLHSTLDYKSPAEKEMEIRIFKLKKVA